MFCYAAFPFVKNPDRYQSMIYLVLSQTVWLIRILSGNMHKWWLLLQQVLGDEHLATVTRYMLDMIEINWRNGGK